MLELKTAAVLTASSAVSYTNTNYKKITNVESALDEALGTHITAEDIEDSTPEITLTVYDTKDKVRVYTSNELFLNKEDDIRATLNRWKAEFEQLTEEAANYNSTLDPVYFLNDITYDIESEYANNIQLSGIYFSSNNKGGNIVYTPKISYKFEKSSENDEYEYASYYDSFYIFIKSSTVFDNESTDSNAFLLTLDNDSESEDIMDLLGICIAIPNEGYVSNKKFNPEEYDDPDIIYKLPFILIRVETVVSDDYAM